MLMRIINKLLVIVTVAFLMACTATPKSMALRDTTESKSNTLLVQKTTRMKMLPELAKTSFNKAMWFAKTKKLDQAIQSFNNITKNYPDFARAYTNLGLLHLQQNDLIAAEQALVHAVSLYPEDPISLNHLGVVLRKLGKFKQAESAYLNAIKHDSKYADAYYNLGILNDIYLQNLVRALNNYQLYLFLIEENDLVVKKWIVDVKRRITKKSKRLNGSMNVQKTN